ncbi:MAG: DUF1194 domain-containing protein [Pseudomonadota bacterium]
MMRIVFAALFMLTLGTANAAAYCKLALALALDISSSVNDREYRLQLEGLAWALEQEEVKRAILTPEGAHIQAAAYEWSGYPQQSLILDWTRLDSDEAITIFATRLRRHWRRFSEFPTALGKGVEFGAKLLHRSPPCSRKVLDVSGDGENNDGVGPDYFRRQGLLDGLTINGLVILGAFPNPAIYYRANVIQGPNAFLAQARSFEDYREVMLGKLLREIETEMTLGQAKE